MEFYNDFRNFPYPFDEIEVNDLKMGLNYKVLDKYSVSNGIEFARLLKEINLIIGNRPKAEEFSEYGIKKAHELADTLLKGRKTKTYRITEESIYMQLEGLKIK